MTCWLDGPAIFVKLNSEAGELPVAFVDPGIEFDSVNHRLSLYKEPIKRKCASQGKWHIFVL